MKSFIEIKVNDMDEAGKFTGLLAAAGNVDHGFDRFLAGAWKKTLNDRGDRPWPLLHVHNHDKQIGSFKGFDEKKGLRVEGKVNLSTLPNGSPVFPEAFQDHALIKSGEMIGMSVGYGVVRDKLTWTQEKIDGADRTVRNIGEAKLFEGSFVPVPMNEDAQVFGMKGVGGTIEWLTANLDDKELQEKIFSLYGCMPGDLTTLKAEPEESPTVDVEPKNDLYQEILKKLGGKRWPMI